jgi:hypothetical protein
MAKEDAKNGRAAAERSTKVATIRLRMTGSVIEFNSTSVNTLKLIETKKQEFRLHNFTPNFMNGVLVVPNYVILEDQDVILCTKAE